ncbi:DNA-directed primase/polymerase protein-like [Triticum dicoccoides]|uniref:DNA-directed primase/polymerase protein-like n=1 Tax=Triticum dicoccoides TaxID=85692 RepID=UPI000E79186B|nr:DNA-directed primase/polymerase protein-like [Triticum dicoccoides]
MGSSKDDVDRLFACFKCGVSPPQSAFRVRPRQQGKKLRVTPSAEGDGGGSSSSSASTRKAGENASEHREPSSAAIKFRNRKQMSPVVFYGSPQGVPVKKPMSLLRLLREIHIDLKKQTDLISRDVVWATFPRQDEAIRFSKEHAHTKVFSYQDHLSGQRRFLVSTYDEFWRRYNNMDPQIRHHYEVIQEGSPCHIYFDLEFNAKLNQKRDADEMVDTLVAVTFSALQDKYSIEGQEEWIIELDSSNEEKFSRHLIIRIPKTAFKDNSHVGAFTSEICSRIAAQRAANPNLDKLYITKDSSGAEPVDQLFVDTAVYSRNRCFRLAFSSKSGKKSFLVATGRFKCKNMNDKELFMESLICRLDDDCDKLLICKLDLECKKALHFDTEASVTRIQAKNCRVAIDTYRSDFPQAYTYGRSPFPALDGFIESIASFGSVSGKIRCWYWFSQDGLMIYSMSRSRYCEHIGREHKSNHVMYIVDFQRAAYYQKCYDPDCRGYRSPLRAVPLDAIPELTTSIAGSAQRDYQGNVVEFNMEGGGNDGNSVMGSGEVEEDPGWWEEAVKFADSVENVDHAPPASCNLEDGGCDDTDWWTDVERFMVQMESQGDA